MQYRPLGRTGLEVSVVCLGTMTWGQQNTEAEGHAQMDRAVERGVTFFDTAELYSIPPSAETYGATERIIGSWFAQRGGRDKIVLASKVTGRQNFTWFRDDGSPTRLQRKQMEEALHKSLKRLGTDYLDLYQLHSPERPMPWGSNPTRIPPEGFGSAPDETPIAEQLDVLDGFVKAGKVRHIGVSNESAWGVMRFLAEAEKGGKARVQTVQNAYNLLNRTYDTALAEVSLREGISLLPYSPLAQGFLTGKYLDGARPAGSRTALFDRGQRYQTPGAEEAIAEYVALAREWGMEPGVMANAFVMSRIFVAASIVGATTLPQLDLAIDSADVTLPPELIARIDDIHQRRGNPCP